MIRLQVEDYFAGGIKSLPDLIEATVNTVLSDFFTKHPGTRLSVGNFAWVLFIYSFVLRKIRCWAMESPEPK
jgi:hypothetical protein